MNRRQSTLPFQRRFSDRELLNPQGRGLIGGRDSSGRQVPYTPDPLRERSLSYNAGGYMASGYDSGRSF